jgi:hypothetical protein
LGIITGTITDCQAIPLAPKINRIFSENGEVS